MKATAMREMTLRAKEKRVAKEKEEAEQQFKLVIAECMVRANLGESTAFCCKYLSKLALKMLKDDGYTVRDNGDGVASSWEIGW